MDEQQELKEKETETKSNKPVWLALALPASILLAAIMISGTILYSRSGSAGGTAALVRADNQITSDNLKKWAKPLKLDTKAFAQCFDNGEFQDKVNADLAQGTELGVTGTPTFFINGEMVVGSQPFSVFSEAIEKALTAKAPAKIIPVAETDHVQGEPAAPVTIVEFSDFECPYCRRFWNETLSHIIDTYVATGKARLVYKHFPLTSIHSGAQPAEGAAEC